MKNLATWLSEYGETHQNPYNVAIHKLCVPAIMFSLLGLLWQVEVGSTNLAIVLITSATVFYLLLSRRYALWMVACSLAMLAVVKAANTNPASWQIWLGIFIIAWILQFIGHKIEGKKPAFFEDLQFLLIGPLWVLNSLGIKG